LLDHMSGFVSIGDLGELLRVYSTLNGGKEGLRPLVTPFDRGYAERFFETELVGEAVRAYLTNPNYLKTVAPKTGAKIREAINAHPTLSKLIQFNSLGAATFGLPRPDDDQDAARAPDGRAGT
jgi:hypothetical protein